MTDTRVTFHDVGDSALKAQIDIAASPEKVYDAWTQPEHLSAWFGPRDTTRLKVDRLDCEVGGGYDFTMIFSDGDTARMKGTYLTLDPARQLVFTWIPVNEGQEPSESLVTVDLAPSDRGTHLTLTHERFATVEARDEHQGGWGMLLDRLAALLAR